MGGFILFNNVKITTDFEISVSHNSVWSEINSGRFGDHLLLIDHMNVFVEIVHRWKITMLPIYQTKFNSRHLTL